MSNSVAQYNFTVDTMVIKRSIGRMANTRRPPIHLLAAKLWGEKIAKLLEACNFSAIDVEHATGIHNDKVGRWCNNARFADGRKGGGQ